MTAVCHPWSRANSAAAVAWAVSSKAVRYESALDVAERRLGRGDEEDGHVALRDLQQRLAEVGERRPEDGRHAGVEQVLRGRER